MARFKALPGHRRVALGGPTPAALFEAAAQAFTDRLVPLASVEPRRAEELDIEGPELDVLLVDFVTELLYRFDTRGWITRSAEVDLREQDDGWALEAALWGETCDDERHHLRDQAADEAACLCFERRPGGGWRAVLAFHPGDNLPDQPVKGDDE
ncbi:MAG: archease [Vicinamibacterales bacterium]